MKIASEDGSILVSQIASESIYYIIHPSIIGDDFFQMTAVGHLFCSKNYFTKRPYMQRDDYIIIYIVNGAMKLVIDKITTIAESGQVLLFDCKNEHFYSSNDTNAEIIYFHFKGGMSSNIADKLISKYGNKIEDSMFGEHLYDISSLLSGIYNKRTINESIPSILAYSIMTKLSTNALLVYQEKYSHFVNSAVSYLKNSSLTINEIARAISITPQHLMRLFKIELDISPKQYRINGQMSQACNLLMTTDLTIADISDRIGFSSSPNFMTKFKDIYGVSANQYRKLNKIYFS